MIILACNELCLSFATDVVLNKAGFNLQQGEKAGLIGVNGAGKSTIFKIITGRLRQDSGEAYLSRGPVASTRTRGWNRKIPYGMKCFLYIPG